MKEYLNVRKNIWELLNAWMIGVINRETPHIVGFFAFLTVLTFYPLALIPSLHVEAFIYRSIGNLTHIVAVWGNISRVGWTALTGHDFRIKEDKPWEEEEDK